MMMRMMMMMRLMMMMTMMVMMMIMTMMMMMIMTMMMMRLASAQCSWVVLYAVRGISRKPHFGEKRGSKFAAPCGRPAVF